MQNVAAPMNTPVVGGSRQEEPESGPYTGGVEGGDTSIDVINEYGKDGVNFEDMAKVLTSVYENPDDVEKILYANGFDSVEELKGKMQEDGHIFDYFDLTTKLKNMGYEEPKVGEGASFVMDDKYRYKWEYISKEDYITEDEADTHLAPLNEKLEEIRRNKYYLEYYYAYGDSLEEVSEYKKLKQEEQKVLDQIADVERRRLYSQKEEGGFEQYTHGKEITEYDLTEDSDEGIDKEIVSDLIGASLNGTGNYGKEYEAYLKDGRLDVTVKNVSVNEYTRDEAIDLYLNEQEERNELVKDVVEMFSNIENPVGLIAFFANKAIQGNEATGFLLDQMLEEASEKFDGFDIDLIEEARDIVKDIGIDTFLNTMDALHHDINNIQAGTYVKAEIGFTPTKGETELISNLTFVRLIKKYDAFVCDEDNPLSYTMAEVY